MMVSVEIEFDVEIHMFRFYALASMCFLLRSLWCISKEYYMNGLWLEQGLSKG